MLLGFYEYLLPLSASLFLSLTDDDDDDDERNEFVYSISALWMLTTFNFAIRDRITSTSNVCVMRNVFQRIYFSIFLSPLIAFLCTYPKCVAVSLCSCVWWCRFVADTFHRPFVACIVWNNLHLCKSKRILWSMYIEFWFNLSVICGASLCVCVRSSCVFPSRCCWRSCWRLRRVLSAYVLQTLLSKLWINDQIAVISCNRTASWRNKLWWWSLGP